MTNSSDQHNKVGLYTTDIAWNFEYKMHTGEISITLDSVWYEPNSDDPEDQAASERAMQFSLGWFANPVFGSGDYPAIMKEKVLEKSLLQGYNRSRLPEFTEDEVQRILGMGVDMHYCTIY
jgi:beta-glucosidase/6-phospho-beta-glucosidase/beta-galactosidase